MFENSQMGSDKMSILEQQINNLSAQGNYKTSYWTKLSNLCSKMSSDQLNYANTNEEVLKAKSQMVEAFNLFLFETFKDEFVKVEAFEKLADKYVEEFQKAADGFSKNISDVISENERLKEEIKRLKQEDKGGYCNE